MKLSLIVTILFLGFHFSSSQWIPDNEGSFQGLCTEGILPKISLIDGIEQVMLESCVDRCRRHPKCAAIDWIGEPGMDLINYQCNLYAGKPNPSTGSKNSDSTHPWGERKCYLLPMTNKGSYNVCNRSYIYIYIYIYFFKAHDILSSIISRSIIYCLF